MNFDNMKKFMDRLTNWRIPGNDVSVYIENKEVFRYQSGFSDIENKIPMSDDLLFYIYSCSKVITVTAALQLYEKGFFLLDDPLYDFIPEYKELYIRDENNNIIKASNPITLRNLFTMTAGFSYNLKRKSIEEARTKTNGRMDTLEVIKAIAKDPIDFEPGSSWKYSIGHDILAGVVEVVSGEKFRDYVTKNIFNPLEMNESFYHSENVIDKVCNQYKYKNAETDIVKLQSGQAKNKDGVIVKVEKNNPFILGPEYDSGGAGICTSVSDYSKFASALANGGIGPNGERILSGGIIDLMRMNHLNEHQLKCFDWPQLKGCGYGLGVRTTIDKAISGTTGNVGEFGWGGAAGASVLINPELKLSLFYTHHMLNPQEEYYQPRIRNVLYSCI